MRRGKNGGPVPARPVIDGEPVKAGAARMGRPPIRTKTGDGAGSLAANVLDLQARATDGWATLDARAKARAVLDSYLPAAVAYLVTVMENPESSERNRMNAAQQLIKIGLFVDDEAGEDPVDALVQALRAKGAPAPKTIAAKLTDDALG